MAPEPIKIDGLAQFVKNLKKIDGELPKATRIAGNEAASIIVKTAAPKIPLGPGKGGHARSSIKAKSTRAAARVQGGGTKYPYYPWLDFGGTAGPHKRNKRRFLKEGRAIYPMFKAHADAVYYVYVRALLDIARQAGIEVEDSP